MNTLLENPIILISMLCLCWPGIVPLTIMFFVARNYNFKVTKREGTEL